MKYEVALARARSMRKNPTIAEAFMWTKVRRKELLGLKFYRQYILEHAGREYYKAYYIVDFYCPSLGLVIELDGQIHNDPIEKKYDQEREAKLRSMGLKVLRFKNEEVLYNWEAVVIEIRKNVNPNS